MMHMPQFGAEDRLTINDLPMVRGRYTENAPLGEVGWFRTGGRAEILYKPADKQDLIDFLKSCPKSIPVHAIGVLSNTIIRDGGLRGVVVRLGRDFAHIDDMGDQIIHVGATALDMNVALKAAQYGIGGLEFLSGIPGCIGGALKMNAGAYGTETKDVLVEAEYVTRDGTLVTATADDLNMSYRHTDTPEGAVFLSAKLKGFPQAEDVTQGKISEIKAKRSESQPIKAKTGGSTFANPSAEELKSVGLPEDMRVWQIIDAVEGRGLSIGGAQMSELHCNFMINNGDATSHDLEQLGDEIRHRVFKKFGLQLRWEIRRVGEK